MKQKRKGITLYRKWWSKPSQEKEIQKGKIVVWGDLTNSYEYGHDWSDLAAAAGKPLDHCGMT